MPRAAVSTTISHTCRTMQMAAVGRLCAVKAYCSTDRSTPVVQILSPLVSAFRGSQQPALEENDSHLLLVARACGYRLPRAASMRYLTLTISHGKRVLPYVRGRRVHDGRLRDSPRFAVCATTTRTGQLSTCSRSLMRAGEGQDP